MLAMFPGSFNPPSTARTDHFRGAADLISSDASRMSRFLTTTMDRNDAKPKAKRVGGVDMMPKGIGVLTPTPASDKFVDSAMAASNSNNLVDSASASNPRPSVTWLELGREQWQVLAETRETQSRTAMTSLWGRTHNK